MQMEKSALALNSVSRFILYFIFEGGGGLFCIAARGSNGSGSRHAGFRTLTFLGGMGCDII